MDREGGVIDRRQTGGEPRPPGVMAILVPPAILQEVQTVFDPPVVADVPQEVGGGDAVGIEARYEVPHVVRENLAVARTDFTIDAQR